MKFTISKLTILKYVYWNCSCENVSIIQEPDSEYPFFLKSMRIFLRHAVLIYIEIKEYLSFEICEFAVGEARLRREGLRGAAPLSTDAAAAATQLQNTRKRLTLQQIYILTKSDKFVAARSHCYFPILFTFAA